MVARVGGLYCPIALVERLLLLGRYAQSGHGPLLRSTTVFPSQQHLRSSQPSYSTVLSWYKTAASLLGLNPDEYGTHSGRRGGATRAANVDISDRLFKEHGRWRSERAKDGYVAGQLPAVASLC
jgi:hypothetical protein